MPPPTQRFLYLTEKKLKDVKEEEKTEEEKDKEKMSICWPTLPQGMWLKNQFYLANNQSY